MEVSPRMLEAQQEPHVDPSDTFCSVRKIHIAVLSILAGSVQLGLGAFGLINGEPPYNITVGAPSVALGALYLSAGLTILNGVNTH